jgi:thiol-disulfide isomerase/thioredoxin
MGKKYQFRVLILAIVTAGFFLSASVAPHTDLNDHRTLSIGSSAPDFNLLGVDGKRYTLASFKAAKILVIVFTCNHCPTAQAYEKRIMQLASDYKTRGVDLVAIMPNDPKSIRLDELGYTDMGDSYSEMKIRARERHFNFPYLYDGDTESAAIKYGPVATPHVFIFDRARKLRYSGRVDDVEKPTKTPNISDARNAIEALINNKEVPVATTKVFGCSIKWSEKSDWIKKAKAEWAAEDVSLDTIDANGLKKILANKTDKLLLINVWATWCGPCVVEFPELVDMNRMYRRRDFEFISINADDVSKKAKAFEFLRRENASGVNYIYTGESRDKFIDAIDSQWQGPLPYTLVVEPGGKIIYRKQGQIDPYAVKKAIVDDPTIGRYY